MARAGATLINRGNGVIGEMRSAMLTEADFQAQFGSEWVLCDGRSVAGSKYETLTGNASLPDARGVSLRGKNNGRSDGNQNPDGDLALGAFQSHGFGSHNHGGGSHSHSTGFATQIVNPAANNSNLRSGGSDVFINTSSSGTIITTQGGNETRMRNITVNHFIKIN